MAETRSRDGASSNNEAVDQLKIPPHSLEAEQSVLGGLMLNSELFDSVAEKVVKEDFYSRSHQLIYDAMAKLMETGEPLDLLTVSEELSKSGHIDTVGGIPYLSDISRNTPSVANLTAYAGIVRERAVMREMIKVANEIADAGFNPEGRDSSQLLDLAESKVFKIAEARADANEGPENLKSVLNKTIDRIENLFNNPNSGGVTGVSTGYADLDKMTAGLQPSDLVIVAARPSMGKCIVSGSTILDPETGKLNTIDALVAAKQANLISVDSNYSLHRTQASQFVDDGLKPVFKVTTALGREISTTLTHPFLTGAGWQPLEKVQVGDKVAVPRTLPFFGDESMTEAEVKTLAYFIADGGTSQSSPLFTNINQQIVSDFTSAVESFAGISVKVVDENASALSYRVSSDLDAVAELRARFAKRLQQRMAELDLTGELLARQLGVSTASVSQWRNGACVPLPDTFADLDKLLALELEQHGVESYAALSKNSVNAVTEFLQHHGVWGKLAIEKQMPEAIFSLPKQQLALFINRLFSCDGSAFVQANQQARISYSSSSKALIRKLQHLLVRFGIIAKLRNKPNSAYELEILDQRSIVRFIEEIGIFGKERALDQVQTLLATKRAHTNSDTLPESVNDYIVAAKGERSWSELHQQAGLTMPQGFNPHLLGASKRLITRERAAMFAKLLNDDYLLQLSQSDLYWDRVIAIEPLGMQQVYDLTVPDTHNFIAEDVCVHNTTFAMNLCEQAAMNEDKPVLIFSLEMPSEQIMMRMLASLGRVNQTRIRTGELDDDDWARVTSTMGIMMDQGKMYIDDGSGLTPTEVRSRARRIAREHGGISMIMVDYLQLMQVPALSDNRTLEIAEISRSLKALAKELQCPVVALSQLNRSLEQRADKRPVNSDLRESGSIEQDADLIMFIYRDEVYHPDTAEKGQAEIIIGKQRNGPIGRVPLTFQGQFSRFDNYSGTSFEYDE